MTSQATAAQIDSWARTHGGTPPPKAALDKMTRDICERGVQLAPGTTASDYR